MTLEESEQNPNSDHSLDWLVGDSDSDSFLQSFFFDDHFSGYIDGYDPFNQGQCSHHLIDSSVDPLNPTDSSYEGKISNDPLPMNLSRPIDEANVDFVAVEKPVKRSRAKGLEGNGNNGHNGRWAEQLLLPCAAAIAAGDLSKVQHLLYVVKELASAAGDANHRLAHYGLRALNRHLSASPAASSSVVPLTFASSDPGFFQKSLIKFNERSPWFAFPNGVANASILQILAGEEHDTPERALHIVDIGVSHGVQWPTLLEALARRPGGAPPLVRLTVASAVETGRNTEPPFSVGPPGDDFKFNLQEFAKLLKINLEIDLIKINNEKENPLQSVTTQINETLIANAQFRLHQLSHTSPDERTEFLNSLKQLNPKGVVLVENDADCSCEACGDFGAGFKARVEHLWRFLGSTSSAFNRLESKERSLMEGEAAKGLSSGGERNERKEKWGERMRGCGFVGVGFGGDAIEGARALLRNYSGSWAMKVEEKERDGCVSLLWKGQPVSFCSLWKVRPEK